MSTALKPTTAAIVKIISESRFSALMIAESPSWPTKVLNNDEGFVSDVFNSLDTAGNGVLKRVDLIKALRKNTKTL